MFESIGGFLTSIFSGGVTGILGVAVQRIADYKNKQLDLQQSRERMAHEVLMKKADAELMAQEWAARTKVAQVEAQGEEAREDAKAFAASMAPPVRYSSEVKVTTTQAWLLVILDFIRGIVRPGLTLYLSVLTTLIYFHARKLLNEQLSQEQAIKLVELVINTVLYLNTTCLLWWFGVRNKQKAPKI